MENIIFITKSKTDSQKYKNIQKEIINAHFLA